MSPFAGTGMLVRAAVRRDRIQLIAWVAGLLLLLLSTASSFSSLYPTVDDRLAVARSIETTPSFRALYGVVYNPTSLGSLVAWRLVGGLVLGLGLMNLLLTVRHTRGDEESGRAELIGAGAVGRLAPIASAFALTGLANLAFVVIAAVGLTAMGLGAAGSLALPLTVAVAGWVFAGVAALTAQLARTARGAGGLAGAALGLAYLLRVAGDAGNGVLSWLSPMGWAQQTRAFADERWWLPALSLAVAGVFAAAAVAMAARRDLGAGVLPDRAGRATAAPSLSGPFGLAWRLQRGVLIGWAAGFAAVGAVVGAIAKDVGSFVDNSPQMADYIRQIGGEDAIVDAYVSAVLGLLAMAAAGYVLQATLRIRGEETSTRAEQVLAGSVSRWSWAAGHVVCAAVGTAVVLAAAGVTMGLAHGLRTGDVAGQLPRLVESALVQVPAAWVLGGLAILLIGFAPRALALAWAALGAVILIGWIGPALELPQAVLDVSPFTHTPLFPLTDVTWTPLVLLAAVAAALALAGLSGLRRRDLGP